jgi:hypothetical protein
MVTLLSLCRSSKVHALVTTVTLAKDFLYVTKKPNNTEQSQPTAEQGSPHKFERQPFSKC